MTYTEVVSRMNKNAADKWNASQRAMREGAAYGNEHGEKGSRPVDITKRELVTPDAVNKEIPESLVDFHKNVAGTELNNLPGSKEAPPVYNGWRGYNALVKATRAVANAKDRKEFNEAYANQQNLRNDIAREIGVTGDWWESLKLRAPSYAAWLAGSGLVGRLIAGKKHRLAGWLIGGLAGLGANYARRKSYYGDAINW